MFYAEDVVNNKNLGLVCIGAGIILLVLGSPFLWHILITLLALWLIHYGLILRGDPGLMIWIVRFSEAVKSLFYSK